MGLVNVWIIVGSSKKFSRLISNNQIDIYDGAMEMALGVNYWVLVLVDILFFIPAHLKVPVT